MANENAKILNLDNRFLKLTINTLRISNQIKKENLEMIKTCLEKQPK